MNESDAIPDAIRRAFESLKRAGAVEIIAPLRQVQDGRYPGDTEFRCRVDVPHPNAENLPPTVVLRVVVAATFPLCTVDVYPEDETVSGFPHQDAETGKLCLRPSFEAPWDVTRLERYLEWAKEWLRDAAQGALLAPGDPYELPDFSRRDLKLPYDGCLLFDESAANFRLWEQWIGKSGVLELKEMIAPPGFAAVSFEFPNGAGVHQPPLSSTLFTPHSSLRGRWILLPRIDVFRHRPAQRFDELEALCRSQTIQFKRELCKAWEQDNKGVECGLLLIGFPIPRTVGDKSAEIHWQPLIISTCRLDKKRKPSKKVSRQSVFERVVAPSTFGPSQPLPWGKSTNIAHARLFARGGHDEILRGTKMAVCGCGALGSIVCELLVRGGVSHMSIFDNDLFSVDNQCRHTLDGTHVGKRKATALARRLATTNPLGSIRGFPFALPLPPKIPKDMDDANAALHEAELLIDCTTDEAAFIWLNDFARAHRKRLVSIFFNFGAEVLTLCVSGKHTSCEKVCRRLYQDVRDGQTPVSPGQWDPEPASDEFIIPGAGCWHPTFPAVNSHVWMLAAAAVDVMNFHLPRPPGCDGLGALVRRNKIRDCHGIPTPLIEIAWMRRYR